MNKQQLLALAKNHDVGPWALAANKHASSAEAADKRIAELARLIPVQRKFAVACGMVMAVLLGFGMSTMSHGDMGKTLSILIDCFIGGFTGFLCWSSVSDYLVTPTSREKVGLEKIAGSQFCEEALVYVRGSESARQWRDLIIAERELRLFDVRIMAALSTADECSRVRERDALYHAENEKLKAALTMRYNEACKELHGISEGTPA